MFLFLCKFPKKVFILLARLKKKKLFFSDLLFLASLCANSEVWVRDEDPASYASDWLILTNRLISLVGLISVVSEGSGFDSGCVSF